MIHPAYLWLGSNEILQKNLNSFLKKILCKNYLSNNKCDNNNCIECQKINANKHHSIRYLTPEKNLYSVSDLDVIFETIIFALDENQHFFFIIDKADLLNLACANKLLKSLEEPARGYHFILLAQKKDTILPTIISRCLIEEFESKNAEGSFALLKYFTSNKTLNLDQFLIDLTQNKIPETEILNFLDEIYKHWHLNLTQALSQSNSELIKLSQSVLNLVDELRQYPPMPGSSLIFLKNLFMQFNNLITRL